jgi:hypothetical protein
MNSSPGQILTTLPRTMDTSDFSTYQIVAFVIIFLIVASIIYYTKDYLYFEWKKLYPVNELTGETPLQAALSAQSDVTKSESATLDYGKQANDTKITGSLMAAEPSKPDHVLENAASSEQTWCLVGEDMAGRWCIQVKGPAQCEPIRTYKTKNKCEQSE